MSADPGAATVCAGEVRTHDFPRYATTLFGPPERRRSLLALYAFAIEVGRVRDHISQPLPGEIRLQWWSDALAGTARGEAAGNPVASELFDAIGACGLPVERLSALIEAHRFDLYDDPMSSITQLEDYCDATTGALYELAAGILGHRSAAIAHLAHHAGIADGIATLLARLPVHAARRQMFVPEDVLAEHGARPEDIFAGKASAELFAAIDHLAGEARAHLASATQLIVEVPRDVRPAFLQLAVVHGALKAVGRRGFDPFRPVPPSRLSVLWRIWRAARAS
jgi:phytoene synthase